MKAFGQSFLIAVLPVLCGPGLSGAADSGWSEKISLSVVAGFQSEYVYRGEKRAGASLQPGVEAGYPLGPGDAYAGVWASQAVDGGGGDEIDFYAGYAAPLSRIVAIAAGLTRYTYPEEGDMRSDSSEPFLGIFADLPLRPAFFGYYDVEQEQILGELSLGGTIPLRDELAAEWALDLGAAHARKMDGVAGRRQGFWFGGAELDLVWTLNPVADLSAGLAYQAREEAGFKDFLTWSVAVEMGF